jgi:hypothetical protein
MRPRHNNDSLSKLSQIKIMNKSILPFLILLSIWFLFFRAEPSKTLPAGVLVKTAPIQNNLNNAAAFEYLEYEITPLADFRIKAKILAKEYYKYDEGAKLSFLDLALGWGKMSDQSVIDQLEISQSGRWYSWKTKENFFPIPRQEIESSSANMHMIVSDDYVKSKMKDSRVGDIIELRGHLVKVLGEDNWRWKSSLTRNDTGGGACELIWVEDFTVITP